MSFCRNVNDRYYVVCTCLIFINLSLTAAEENPGMKEVHHEMLRSNLLLFQEKLDVVKMIQCLGQAEIITVDNPGLAQAVSEVMDQQTKKKQVEKLICEVLPQLGPNSYDAFITILQRNQPQLAHDFQQSIKGMLTVGW